MPAKRSQLAKLTRPRLHKAVARQRLFALLDEAREHKPAICVVGPPGAGKTTLIASWLDARGIPGIWYQVDPGDTDLSTFFYYLAEAAKSFARKGERPLPLLTPEYLHDIEGFSRRFFRDLFAWLPVGATLVLDNYQEVAPEQKLHSLIANAVDEVPSGVTLIAVSRRDLPDCYARLIANEKTGFLDWGMLKLTLKEARAIAELRVQLSAEDLGCLHDRSGGWAAGFTLLLEGSRNDDGFSPGGGGGRDALFDYFAAQIFAKIPHATQTFLVATACLPQVPVSIARKLTGNADAEAILEDLYRRHLFTHRQPTQEPTYWYHALFREFLLARAHRLFTQEQRREWLGLAGRLLNAHGHLEAAFSLLCRAEDWRAAEVLILNQAPGLLGQGRGETLRGWIVLLPETHRDANPWLRYWLGVSLVHRDQTQARAQLEFAFDAFRSEGDKFGQMRSISRIIDTYFFEWSEWQPLDRWIDTLEPLMLACTRYPSKETEFDIHCSMLIATLYRRPGHPLLKACVGRVASLLESDLDVNRKVAGLTLLLTYYYLSSQLELGQQIVALAGPLLNERDVTPLNRVWWFNRLAYFLNACGEHEAVLDITQEARAIIESHGLKAFSGAAILVEWHLGWALMAMRQWGEAGKTVQKLEHLARDSRPSDPLLVTEARLRLAMSRGDLAAALREVPRAVGAANTVGMIFLQAKQLANAVEVFAESGLHSQARAQAAVAYELVRATCLEYWVAEIQVIEAYIEWREGNRERCLELLSESFSQGARYRLHWQNAGLSGRVLARMCAEALDAGIEVEYVKSLVRRFRLEPPELSTEAWPWTATIYTLGRFELWCDGKRVEFPHKVPKKPLALLKAIVAFGGRNVPEERLMDALWPDEEADAARKTLDITVLRLRKLLGSHDAIIVSDESVGLNPQQCWTDLSAFEQCVDDADGRAELASRALRLYRGSFLPTNSEEPWTVKARERLRNKFVRLTEVAAREEENAGRWEAAIGLYLKGLEADELVEPFYQGLMRCYRALGRNAEAMNAYRRLRQLLSVVLGISPSESTQSMALALQRDNPAKRDTL